MAYIEDTDDYIQMNESADYYKDEYGICPYCKHKLSEEEMERKMLVFTILIVSFYYEPIKVILGIMIIVLAIRFVLKIFDWDYKAHIKQRARYNNDILHEMGKDREYRKNRGRWYD